MKKVLIIAAAFFAAVVILLGIYAFGPLPDEYSGKFSFSLGGVSYDMQLESVEHFTSSDNEECYIAIYSDGTNSCHIGFSLWREDGDIWIHLDDPRPTLNGETHYMRRNLNSNHYSFDMCGEYMVKITFWGAPFSNGDSLGGIFTLINQNNDLI